MGTLYERLKNYGESDHYGFHMPGHKRQTGIPGMEKLYQIDVTEIEGFDDLHHPRGILKEAQERAARVFQAEETHFLINGSTVGILSALAGVTRRGDTVLVARNCHKSVYHAIYMKELKPVYLYPGFDQETGLNTQISPEDVRRALKADSTIRAVVIVSPTYEGIVSDVEKIGEEAHARGIPLIVDEAHGAHFGFHPYFPGNSNTKGADLVVQSLHKTLPSFNSDRPFAHERFLCEPERSAPVSGYASDQQPFLCADGQHRRLCVPAGGEGGRAVTEPDVDEG